MKELKIILMCKWHTSIRKTEKSEMFDSKAYFATFHFPGIAKKVFFLAFWFRKFQITASETQKLNAGENSCLKVVNEKKVSFGSLEIPEKGKVLSPELKPTSAVNSHKFYQAIDWRWGIKLWKNTCFDNHKNTCIIYVMRFHNIHNTSWIIDIQQKGSK